MKRQRKWRRGECKPRKTGIEKGQAKETQERITEKMEAQQIMIRGKQRKKEERRTENMKGQMLIKWRQRKWRRG